MRTIDFRGKTIKGAKWIYGDLVRTNGATGDGWAIQYFDPEDGWIVEDVQAETIGQFTGIVDSNNRRIYEGDVLKVKMSEEQDCLGRFIGRTDIPPFLKALVKYNERMCKFELLLEENEQCGDHHLVSCEIGWSHDVFIILGKFIEMPFKLECDRNRH